jgi:hypothetical protein
MENKKLKLGILAIMGSAGLSAQSINPDEVPSELKTTFEKEYDSAREIEWEKDSEMYKVEFEINRA